MDSFDLNKEMLANRMNDVIGLVFSAGQHSVIRPEQGLVHSDLTNKQVAWYLEHDKVEDDSVIKRTCNVNDCISHLKLDLAPSDDELMRLVQKDTVSLAELYRRGKKRGLIQAAAKGYA